MSEDGGWKFAQCFGDKGDVEELSAGILDHLLAFTISQNN
jgi:hypothetical protein